MMDAVPNMVPGVAQGAAGWWMLEIRWRPVAWIGVACIVAAVHFLVTGAIAVLVRPAALNVITVAGAAMAASEVFAEME